MTKTVVSTVIDAMPRFMRGKSDGAPPLTLAGSDPMQRTQSLDRQSAYIERCLRDVESATQARDDAIARADADLHAAVRELESARLAFQDLIRQRGLL